MLIVTSDSIPGKEIQVLGMVHGGVVQSTHLGKDILAGFKTIVGGEITSYTEIMDQARAIAIERMVMQAQQMGADAIISMRYSSSSVMQSAAEQVAYGTAVKFI